LRRQKIFLSLPLVGLLVSFVILYFPNLFSINVTGVSDLKFLDKTSLFAAFAFAAFACVESYSTFDHASFEHRRYQIEDARNELEKAYGPLYSMMNKATAQGEEKKDFWLEYDERKKIDDVLATYPFMFSAEINKLWQEKIRSIESIIETSAVKPGKLKINLDAYAELKSMVDKEYTGKVKKYHELLGK
jgi:hypothetical protein